MFCPHCGASLEDLSTPLCPQCGKEISSDSFSELRDESDSVLSPPPKTEVQSPQEWYTAPPGSFQVQGKPGTPSVSQVIAPRKKSPLPFVAIAAALLILAAGAIFFFFQQRITPEQQQERMSNLTVDDYAFLSLNELEKLIGPLEPVPLPEDVTDGNAYQTICTPPTTFILDDNGVTQVIADLEEPLPYHVFLPMVSITHYSMEDGCWLELTKDAAVISGISDRVSQAVFTFEEPVYSFPELADSKITRYRIVLDDQVAGFYHSNSPYPTGHRIDPALVPEDEKIGTDVITGNLRNLSNERVIQATVLYEWSYWGEGARPNSTILYAEIGEIPPGGTAPYTIEIPKDFEGFSSIIYGTAGLWEPW